MKADEFMDGIRYFAVVGLLLFAPTLIEATGRIICALVRIAERAAGGPTDE